MGLVQWDIYDLNTKGVSLNAKDGVKLPLTGLCMFKMLYTWIPVLAGSRKGDEHCNLSTYVTFVEP